MLQMIAQAPLLHIMTVMNAKYMKFLTYDVYSSSNCNMFEVLDWQILNRLIFLNEYENLKTFKIQ